jgi:hypothetical protein
MSLLLHTIIIDADKELAQIESLLGPKASENQRTRLVRATNKLAQLALLAYQSKVPIKTGELRNQRLQVKYATQRDGEAEIYVSDAVHTEAKTQSSILAELLDTGTRESRGLNLGPDRHSKYFIRSDRGRELLRSKDSDAVSPYYSSLPGRSPTGGWIRSARVAFNNVRGRFSV